MCLIVALNNTFFIYLSFLKGTSTLKDIKSVHNKNVCDIFRESFANLLVGALCYSCEKLVVFCCDDVTLLAQGEKNHNG